MNFANKPTNTGNHLPVMSITDVVQRQLCTGRGICAAIEPATFDMIDAVDWGKRPKAIANAAPENGSGMAASPGAALDIRDRCVAVANIAEITAGWGPVLEVWEGHATDEQIRMAGSSGGAATALSLYAIEQGGLKAVLHTAADPEQPLINRSVTSRSRADLWERTGSRYAPASPCDSLYRQLSELRGSAVFLGKPCDVTAAYRACQSKAERDGKIGLTVAFFCAGPPSARGTLDAGVAQGGNQA